MIFQKKAFTLVELIVVITILAVLSTIWFVSYSWYLAWTRDTNRISQLKAISDWLHLFWTNHNLPNPDDKIDIEANSTLIAYQGYAWKNTLETITYSTPGLDPKDKTYFSYYLTRDKKYFQLMAFLEEEDNLQTAGIFNKTNAVDYSIRYPTVFGDKLGILTWTWADLNIPIQEIPAVSSTWSIDIITTTLEYRSHMRDNEIASGTWVVLFKMQEIASVWWQFCGANPNELYCLDVPLVSNLVGFWDFEWWYTDKSETKNTGTAYWNSSIYNTVANSWRNNYASFQSTSSDYVAFLDNPNYQLANWTVSLWVKINDTTKDQGILSRDASWINHNWHLDFRSIDDWTFDYRIQHDNPDESYHIISKSYDQSKWNHVLVTFGSDWFKLYVNGILDLTNFVIGDDTSITTPYIAYTWWIDWNNNPLAIWASADWTWDGNLTWIHAFADALIDNVMIYNVALSASEVKELYDKQK